MRKPLKISLLCPFILSVLLLACKTQSKDVDRNDRMIISTIIDQFSMPLPPYLKPETTDTVIVKKTVDSLNRIQMYIALYPIMENTMDSGVIKKLPKEVGTLLNKSLSSKLLESTKGIISRKGHRIQLADTVGLKKSYDFTSFDLLFNFSRIFYDDQEKTAIVEVGISRSRRNGYSTLCFLEKINEEWIITQSISTTIW